MKRSIGSRGRIGVVVIDSSRNMEPEFHAMCPPGVSVYSTRIALPQCDVNGLTEMTQSGELEQCVRLLAAARPDSIIYAGMSASFLKGPGWDQLLIQRMEKASGGIPCTTSTTAVVAALRELGIRRISVATPYLEEIDKLLCGYLGQIGFEIVRIKGLRIREPIGISNQSPEIVYGLVKEVDRPESEGIFISCTDFAAGTVVEDLERELKKPVVAAIQASFWHVLKLAHVSGAIEGFGALLKRL
jgi:maleate isomerase